jgi:hypothetical protein
MEGAAVLVSDTPATPNTQEITALATAIAGNVFEKVGVLRERYCVLLWRCVSQHEESLKRRPWCHCEC